MIKNKATYLILSVILALGITRPITNASYLVKYHKEKIKIENNRRFNIYVSEVNSKFNRVKIELGSEKLNRLKNVSSIRTKGTQIAINTNYFKPDSGLPLGLVVRNNEIITSPLLNRVSFGLDSNNNPIIGIPKLEGNADFGDKKLPINFINQPVFDCKGLTLLNHRYVTKLPKLNHNFKFITIKDNKVTGISANRLYPDINSVVLVGSKIPSNLKIGDTVTINYNLSDEFKDITNAVSGGTYLVKDSKIFIDYKDEKFTKSFVSSVRPRTAIGIDKNNNILIVVVGSSSIYDEAKIMKKLGCVQAMNFDGGSSTQMLTPKGLVGSRRGISVALTIQ